ncbi:hypothetical protein SLEP1_g34989 [Rubroshorea leprosula]|uniref:EF-hand domain-containing protein n=1 Tax=Rubroshorea leprosula TaxID=152421 RepID=A0AAV5KLU1_9ROSI|nr:hypothetical protein SLEP1_g34989 [Rubroshorea leprosula]
MAKEAAGLATDFQAVPLDPLVTRIERSLEERGLVGIKNPVNQENISYLSDVVDASEYFSDGGSLNITKRLITLFPLLDISPADRVVSFEELETWNIKQAQDRLSYRTHAEMVSRDENGDGAISFNEYLPQFTKNDTVITELRMGHGEAGWWIKQFDNAGADWSGSLSVDEFNNFLLPEDSNNERIHKWDEVLRMDYDHDMKLNFKEFLDHVYDIYKNYIAFEAGGYVPTAEEKFAEVDLGKDKFLEVEELKPMLRYLYPGELSYAKYYTSYLIHEADDNEDGKLSMAEMLNHENLFYNTLYDDGSEDYEDLHDEL